MTFLYRHIPAIGRLFVLLFFVANSGFTVVLYHCTMEEKDCCTTSNEHLSCDFGTMDLPQTPGVPSVTTGDNCHSMTIAGGVKTDPKVVEKESVTRVIKVDLAATFTPVFALSTVPSLQQPFSSTASQNASSPSVETYVLNSTFLI